MILLMKGIKVEIIPNTSESEKNYGIYFLFTLIVMLFIFCTILTSQIIGLNTTFGFQAKKIERLEAKVEELEKDRDLLQVYFRELEASDALDKNDIMGMYKSLAIIRGNFLALGHGYFLEEEDICPEDEPKCKGDEDENLTQGVNRPVKKN